MDSFRPFSCINRPRTIALEAQLSMRQKLADTFLYFLLRIGPDGRCAAGYDDIMSVIGGSSATLASNLQLLHSLGLVIPEGRDPQTLKTIYHMNKDIARYRIGKDDDGTLATKEIPPVSLVGRTDDDVHTDSTESIVPEENQEKPSSSPSVQPVVESQDSTREAELAALCQLYEDECFGSLTPLVGQELADVLDEYGFPKVRDAITKAVVHDARRWSYVFTILRNEAQGKTKGEAYDVSRFKQSSRW